MEFSFNQQQAQEAANEGVTSYALLERGEYPLVIIDAEEQITKSGTGKYLKVEFEVAQGHPNSGKKVWSNLTISNPSEKAVEIGIQQLTRLCAAVGMQGGFAHESELRGKSFVGEIGIEKSKNPAYDDQNKVYAYKPANGNGATAPAPAIHQPQQPAQSQARAWD